MATIGVVDLILKWREQSTVIEKLRAEAREKFANASKLEAEAEKLEAEARNLRAQLRDHPARAKLDIDIPEQESPSTRRLLDRIEHVIDRQLRRYTEDRPRTSPAACRFSDPDILRAQAGLYAVPPWMACHLCNRMLPSFAEILRAGAQKVSARRIDAAQPPR